MKSDCSGAAMPRRDALRGMAGLAALASLHAGGATTGKAPPNIVFVLVDDHRYDCLGCLGHPFLETPNLDRLAKEGVLFENAFVTTSLCSPSRASFLTGQYASVHGVRGNYTPWRSENVTFLELLKAADYDTAFIGKWHMPGEGLPSLRGVDQFVSFTKKDGQGDYYDCPLFVNGKETPSRTPYITEELTDYAIDFVKEKREAPFCLYLSHKAAHHDFRPPPHIAGRYADADLSHLAPESDTFNTWTGLNWLEGTLGTMHRTYRRYCECLASVDEQLGRLLETLEDADVLDNTLIVYAGDNGYLWGEHRLYAKHWPYEESIRIPLIVRYPGLIREPGRRASQMALNIDLAPSLLEVARAGYGAAAMQGESFIPLLTSSEAPGRKAWVHELFKDFPFGCRVPPHKALRTERYKYIEWAAHRSPEIYDLEQDPREMHNLLTHDETSAKRLLPELQAELKRQREKYGLLPS